MPTSLSRGSKILLAWAMFVQVVLVVLVGLSLSKIDTGVNDIVVISHGRSGELMATKQNTEATKRVEVFLLHLVQESRHPGEVGTSIEYQVCHAVDVIAHKPLCRIP